MGKPSAPTPPDPRLAAEFQQGLNREQMLLNARLNRPNQRTPFGGINWTTDPEGSWWSQEEYYDPRIVESYFADVSNQRRRSDMSGFMADAVTSMIRDPSNDWYRPFDPQHIPGAAMAPHTNPLLAAPDLTGLAQLPGQNDFGAERQRVEDSIYGRQTSRLDPQYQQRRDALEAQLANEGFARDSEGWQGAMADFEREREAAYAGARQDAIMGGGSEQSRMFADALQARGQGVGERFQTAGFYNQAAGQDYDQRFRGGQFANAIRSQRFQEELTKRNQPFAEYMQLIHGNAPNMPQFANPAQIQGMPAADYLGALGNQFAGQMGRYNTQMGSKNAGLGGAASIAAAYFLA